MKKENFMREIALLKEDGDSFGFVLDGNTQKGIVIFVVPDCDSESENAMEYMIEGNNIVDGAFEPCSDYNYSCAYPDWNEAWELTMEQVQGAIPSPLPLGQSLLVVWPQLTGLIAATVICFAISYIMFMRREIRSR